MLEDKEFVASYTKESQALLSKHYNIATTILDGAGIDYVRNGYAFPPSPRLHHIWLIPRDRNAGFFIWIDLSPYISSKESNDDGWKAENTLKELITNAGIPIASGAAYRAETPGWFRVLFTVDEDSLKEALRRYIVL